MDGQIDVMVEMVIYADDLNKSNQLITYQAKTWARFLNKCFRPMPMCMMMLLLLHAASI